MTSAQRDKWLKVMTTELMSSEESEDDSIIVHPLPCNMLPTCSKRLMVTAVEKSQAKLRDR